MTLDSITRSGLDILPQLVTFAHSVHGGTLRAHPPSQERFTPVSNRALWHKPGEGGLWTSSFLGPEKGSDWEQWRITEDFGDGEVSAWRLAPEPSARVLRIDSADDFTAFYAVYGLRDSRFESISAIDFERIAADGWDGIWLTEEGQWATRLTRPGLYGWDCESVLWLRWAFIGAAREIPVSWWTK